MFTKKTIKDINVRDKVVLVRVDYNVPMKDGVVTSDLRIRASLPTISYLYQHGAKKIILCSHLGRPDGEKKPELSLKPVAETLRKLIAEEFPKSGIKDLPAVGFVSDVSGPDVEEAVNELPKGSLLLLENLRFFPGEENNSIDFIREIIESVHAQIFVQDGFAVVHRAHASTEAVTHEIPSVAGLLVEKEVSTLTSVLQNPTHPVLVIIGGAKVDDKQPLIDAFADLADHIAVLGKIAADGYEAPTSIAQKVYVAEDFREDAEGKKLDVGDQSVEHVKQLISEAKTVVWNGVAGYVENPEFEKSSAEIAEALGRNNSATTVVCGGDTAGYVENFAAGRDNLSYSLISTGGGASLELLSGATLPGVSGLDDN